MKPIFRTNKTYIWDAGSVGAGMSNFDVDANPKISISIPVDLPRRPEGMAKIIDFCDVDAL